VNHQRPDSCGSRVRFKRRVRGNTIRQSPA